MKYLRCETCGDFFTPGKLYPILDYLEGGGFVVADDDSQFHYLSGEFASVNFTKGE